MNLQLTGKLALVSGSTKGIGYAIAQRLIREGCSVIFHGRTETSLRSIRNIDPNIVSVFADLAKENAGSLIADQLREKKLVPDILINNAGLFVNRDWKTAGPADWMHLYQVNVASHVGLIQALIPGMKRNEWGRIINISSGESTKPFAHMPDYAATKAAMNNMTVSLSKHLAGTGITVNTVSPGIIKSDSVISWFTQEAASKNWGTDWPEIEQAVVREVLPNNSGRLGQPEEVANLVAFLSSPLTGYINGANIRIDGGSTDHVN